MPRLISLEIRVAVDDAYYLSTPAERAWFIGDALGKGMVLHSNEVGNEIGPAVLVRVVSGLGDDDES